MKKILFAVMVLAFMSGCAWAQGSAPSVVPWVRSGGLLKNLLGSSANEAVYIIVRHNNTLDTIYFSKSTDGTATILHAPNWRFGTSGEALDGVYTDTMTVSSGGVIVVNGQTLGSLVGSGLVNNGGTLQAAVGASIETDEITNQTILRADMDTTASFVFKHAYDSTSADSLRMLMWKGYVDSTIAGKSITPPTASTNDAYVLKWDSTNSIWTIAADAGAAGGDNVSVDTNGATAGGVAAVVDPILQYVGATTSLVSDTVKVTITGTNSISIDGDTVTASKQWSWPTGRFIGLNYAEIDTITGGGLFGALSIQSQYTGANYVYPSYDFGASTSLSLSSRPNGTINFGHDTTFAATPSFYMTGDTLYGRSSVKSAIKNIDAITADTAIVGGVTLNASTVAQKTTIRDSLVNYVLQTNENLRDSGTGGNDWQVAGTGAVNAFHVKLQQVAGPDTTSIYNGDGTTAGVGVMQIKGSSVQIQGGTGTTVFGSAVQFNSTANHQGQNIDSVKTIDADTAQIDYALRLNGTTGFVGLKSPSTGGSTYFTLPASDGSSGQALVTNGSGTLSFSTVSGGSGSGSALYMTDSSAAHKLDSAIIKVPTGGGIALSMTQITGGIDTLRLSASGLTRANMIANDSIASRKEINDSLVPNDEWKHSGTITATQGSDSVWMNSGTVGVRALNITTTHTGGDTTNIKPDAGGTLVVGKGGTGCVTTLDGDTVRISNASRSGRLFWGKGTTYIDSVKADSIVTAKGRFSGSVSGGDISAVGSMTSGAAFADGTADGQSIGLLPTGGRISFAANGAGVTDDNVNFPTGMVGVGRDTAAYKLDVYDSGVTSTGIRVLAPDTAGSGNNAEISLVSRSKTGGTLGGDAYILYQIQNGLSWSMGVDNSTADRFKLCWYDGLGTNDVFQFDSLGYGVMHDSLFYGEMTPDSMYATKAYVKGMKAYTKRAENVPAWYFPTSGVDSSIQLTWPYLPTESSDTIYLARCSTVTGNDTTFGPNIQFNFEDSVTVDSLILYMRTSSATADSSKLDSLVVGYVTPGTVGVTAVTPISAWGTDRAVTAVTRYAYACAISGLSPGSRVRVRLNIALKENNSAFYLVDACLKGSKQR